MKQLSDDPWQSFAEPTSVGARHRRRRSSSITDFGVFVKVQGGIEGLVHKSNLVDRPRRGLRGRHQASTRSATQVKAVIIELQPGQAEALAVRARPTCASVQREEMSQLHPGRQQGGRRLHPRRHAQGRRADSSLGKDALTWNMPCATYAIRGSSSTLDRDQVRSINSQLRVTRPSPADAASSSPRRELTEGEASSLCSLKNPRTASSTSRSRWGPKGPGRQEVLAESRRGHRRAGWREHSTVAHRERRRDRLRASTRDISKSDRFPDLQHPRGADAGPRTAASGVIEILNKKGKKYFTQDDLALARDVRRPGRHRHRERQVPRAGPARRSRYLRDQIHADKG
ncbi:MAG: hypothetical protein MZU97_12110 [Bacillus subtilis]|nr:hypothetical protein [Bacillus subtilis]